MAVYGKIQRSLLGKCCLPSRGVALTEALQSIGEKVVPPFEKVKTVDLPYDGTTTHLTVGTKLYAGIGNMTPAHILKVNLEMLEIEEILYLETGEGYVNAMITEGGYLYAGLATSPAKVVKVDLSTFKKVATLTLEGENLLRCLACDGTYLYAGLDAIPAKVVKISLAAFTKVETLDLEESDTQGVYALTISGGYLYAGLYFMPAKIVKVDLSAFTKVSTLTFDAGEDAITGLVAIGDFLYASLNTDPAKVVKVDLSTFTKVSTLRMPTGEDAAYTGLAAYKSSYLYFGTHTSPSIIEKISVATFERVDAITLDAGESYMIDIVVDGNYIYVGTSLVDPAKIVKIGVGE